MKKSPIIILSIIFVAVLIGAIILSKSLKETELYNNTQSAITDKTDSVVNNQIEITNTQETNTNEQEVIEETEVVKETEVIEESEVTEPEIEKEVQTVAKPQTNDKGQPLVPNFTLLDTNGNSVSLYDYEGQVVILNFWATWCPYCLDEMEDFNEMNNEFINDPSLNTQLLEINMTDGRRETKEKAIKYLDENGYNNMICLLDTNSEVARMFNITSLPTTIIIDTQGYLSYYTLGATTKEKLEPHIEEARGN